MDLLQFHKMRTAIQHNASPGTGQEVAGFETSLRAMLLDSGLFESVEVEHTQDEDQLVIALCQFRPFYADRDVSGRLEQLWEDRVRYPFWEAHSMSVQEGHIEFEAATRQSSAGHYVTVHLVAQKAGIPAQRGPQD